jgi:hypothetical protein
MKAILVTVEITTRIIVDDEFDLDDMRNEDYDTVREKAYPRIIENLTTDAVGDHLTEVVLDGEIPFGELDEDTE